MIGVILLAPGQVSFIAMKPRKQPKTKLRNIQIEIHFTLLSKPNRLLYDERTANRSKLAIICMNKSLLPPNKYERRQKKNNGHHPASRL